MSDPLLNTKEVARYLGIHEKQVYVLVKAGRLPGTRLTGKWMFPKALLDDWIAEDARRTLGRVRAKAKHAGGALLAAGSNDPVLDMLGASFRRLQPGRLLFCAPTGSTDGLRALDRGHTDLAWSHLWEPETGEYNIPFLRELAPNVDPAVVTFFHREIGFVTPRGNPHKLRDWADLRRRGVRFINRQAGSGTRVLLDHHLGRLDIEPERIHGYENEAATHLEVGLAVLGGEATAGLATASVARLLGLAFVPLAEERFDIVLDRKTYFEAPFQDLMSVIVSADFRARIERLGGYNLRDTGRLRSCT